jgi:hypothetical protein
MTETVTDGTASIGTTSVEISPRAEPGERVEIIIVNTSTGGQTISLVWNDPAVAGSGVVLYPSGIYSGSQDPSLKLSNLRISAVASLAGGSISIHERRIITPQPKTSWW